MAQTFHSKIKVSVFIEYFKIQKNRTFNCIAIVLFTKQYAAIQNGSIQMNAFLFRLAVFFELNEPKMILY